MVTQDKHNHHKQPRHFLRGFAQTPTNAYQKPCDIWVYKKGQVFASGVNPSLEPIDETGSAKDFYAYKRADGTIDYNTYENFLMSKFEQPNVPILDKIRARIEITSDEKAKFSEYIGAMCLRGDWGRRISELAMADMINAGYTRTSEEIKQLEASDVKINGLLQKACEIAEKIASKEWHFLEADDGLFFVTSDKPVAYSNLDRPEFELVMPLSRDIALSISHQKRPDNSRMRNLERISDYRWKADYHLVGYLRRLICSGAISEIYSPMKMRWLERVINNHPTLESLKPLS